jgi:acetyl-CoA carboxylase carboxyl transferase beta subunit
VSAWEPAVPIAGRPLTPVPHPTNCPGCGGALAPDRLAGGLYVCDCGHHLRIHAGAWIELLADAGTWQERWDDLVPRDVLGWGAPKPYQETLDRARAGGLSEAVRVGCAALAGRPVWLAVFDFRFMGGTLSIQAAERVTRALEAAALSRTPYVQVSASGGARMQEGLLALMQMAKVNLAVDELHREGVPFFSVLTDPTFGGTTASLALLADVNIAEPGATIGFTGARVIRQATFADLPAGFQSAAFQLAHGQVDMVVPRTELRPLLARLLDLFWYARGGDER